MSNQDRALGAYIGAAIGDAMGGPVEGRHAVYIRRVVGEITGLLPYRKPYTRKEPHPGYTVRTDAGAVTDDTFIRGDFTRFYLDTQPPRTPEMVVDWMLANADFSMWWPPMIEGMERIQRGEVSAAAGGQSFFQGGGIGYWTPIGILYAGQPDRAAAEVRRLSSIWKAPLEQDFLAAIQAGQAEAMRDGATDDSVVETMLASCGALAQQLLQRAIDIGRAATSVAELADRLYNTALMPELELRHEEEPPRAVDAPLPPRRAPLPDSDERYMSSFFAEQAPFAVAAFVYAQGDPRIAIPATVMLGRDCDSTATTVGGWVGALHGESGLPAEWVETVCEVNRQEIDIRGLAEKLYALSQRARSASGDE